MITPRDNAKPLSYERLENLKAAVANKGKRNPFQRFAFDTKERKVNPNIDLTWIYRLSSIGKDNIKGHYATIDKIDYYKDDKLGNKQITEIQADRVILSEDTQNGKQNYIIKFRTVPTNNKP